MSILEAQQWGWVFTYTNCSQTATVVPPRIGKRFESGLHQTKPGEYFSEETGTVLLLSNLFFCTCVYHGMNMPLWLASLKWSMTPPDAYNVVTHALAAASREFKHIPPVTEGPGQQNSGISDLDGEVEVARFSLSNKTLFNKRGRINI